MGVSTGLVERSVVYGARTGIGRHGEKRRAVAVQDRGGHAILDHIYRVGLPQVETWIVKVRNLSRNSGSRGASRPTESRKSCVNRGQLVLR